MRSPDPLRGNVAAQLTAMSLPGGPLHTKSDTGTMIRYAESPSRLWRRDSCATAASGELMPMRVR
ncbi:MULTISPECIES: hypothetical protein [unclassified Rhodococcus (in: high G+C Gram-positive bacteria)]|uniref:hypothetical protein n=1 Tax=unclassified Rhodococcus (in: high G+C Gram-positive bacteria) TaxID=192944 RepID=UPI001639BA30|nr:MULTISPECIES: hypothetical protein [unclassified Rhodococcus (in: high G+C Gram-positive bacteria)]MBC2637658.1 hypothetical protein [Rhodococcus sp. 3A]MBC2897598.1 hypothetical protein [Rhodococcus sp. 4CII]